MLGLPKSTECKKQLPKVAIYTKFGFSTAKKEDMDKAIGRLNIVNEVSPATVNIPQGKEVKEFFVIHISLKQEKYDKRIIASLAKHFPFKVLFALTYKDKARLALYYEDLFQTEWQELSAISVDLQGLDFDAVWENIVKNIAGFTPQTSSEQTQDFKEQVQNHAQKQKLEREIAKLEKRMWAETQPKKKMELVERLSVLRKS